MKMSQKKGRRLGGARRVSLPESRAQRAMRTCGASARRPAWTGMWCRRSRPRPSRKARRAHIKDTVRRARVSRSPPACPASLVRVDLLLGSGRRPALTPAGRGGTRSLASRGHHNAPIPTPHRPQRAQGRCRARGRVPPSRLRRCAGASRAAPPSRRLGAFSLPPRRLSEFPSPPLALTAPSPIPPTRRPAPTSQGGGEARSPSLVPTRSRVDRRHQHSGQLRWQRERALHLPSRRRNARDGCWIVSHAAHGDEQLCHLRLRSDETRAPDGTVTLGLSFSDAEARCEGLIDADGGHPRRRRPAGSPEEDFWQDATPENTFTLRVAPAQPPAATATATATATPKRSVLACGGWLVGKSPRWFFRRCLRRWRRSTATRGTSKPPRAPPRNSCVRLSRRLRSLPDRVRRGCAARPGARRRGQPRSCGRNRRRRKRGRRRRRPRVSRRTSRRIRRITWRRIPWTSPQTSRRGGIPTNPTATTRTGRPFRRAR